MRKNSNWTEDEITKHSFEESKQTFQFQQNIQKNSDSIILDDNDLNNSYEDTR